MRVAVLCVVVLAVLCHSHSLEIQNPWYWSKRSQESVASDPSDCASRTRQQAITNPHNFSVDVRMPGVVPAGSDTYLCMSFPVPTNRDAYIVDFIPHASMDTVHHMLLFGCQTPVSSKSYWDCGSVQGTCEDEASIMYAWARNAPPTKLPKDVGFKVGKSSRMSNFVLQIHYGDVGAFRVTNGDVACDYTSYPIYPFAFRTHTHHLGKVVSGYRIRGGKWSLIGRQSPQLPQAFYPANQEMDVKYGDTLAARCVFTGEGRTSKTYIGGTSDDEMCNFYIMYYMDSKHAIPYMNCMETGSEELFQRIPAEANVPIAVAPGHSMMHMGHSTGDLFSLMSKLLGQSQDIVHVHKFNPGEMQRAHAELVAQIDSLMQNKDLGSPSAALAFHTREDPVLVRDRVHRFHQLEATAKPPRSQLVADGQDSNLVIFHRGDHHWGANSFNNQDRYQQRSLGPIQQSTILVVDPAKGNILKASGRNMFFMPHGITTDKENNYWVTDVALHQVLKVSGDGADTTLLALGEAFTPGSDSSHFCKPTDVAIDAATGNVFVSDGYCNARILKFSAEGTYLSEWGAGSSDRRRRLPFRVPHSLVFLPDRQEVCVADRENGRIQCFIAETGEFVKEIKKDEFGGEVFAINYSPAGEVETWVQTKLRPKHNASKTAANQEKQNVAQQPQPQREEEEKVQEEEEEKKKKSAAKPIRGGGVLPAVITTLLLVPLVLVISISVFICWRRNSKAVGSLNLGNFFVSHKGYSRQGFDQLSTEGSDRERNDEDSSDSENEEYSALPPPPPQASSSSSS
ncbi:hypothetical protein F2P81_016442 [Scophthalmus maximus]|uniref:Peptidyl-glycine alpha-amidating monooxygenase n=1 Tax=Scophthalmus maximus TaxID=52904 RepID=A0A6A4SF76_SCOMX|nr:hypothetical protein F2P81_016442 [Scophthalmus maximus]